MSVHQESFTQKLTSIVDIVDKFVHVMKEMIDSDKVSTVHVETKENTNEERNNTKEMAKKLGLLIASTAFVACSIKFISHIKNPTISIKELLNIIILKIKLALIYIKIFIKKKTQLLLEKN